MTDKELLERASKAAGISEPHGVYTNGTWWWYNSTLDGQGKDWNPLKYDSDAFRLLFSIGADVYHGTNEYDEPIITIHPEKISIRHAPSALLDSPNEIRRAIVCAAAATGDQL